jgi:superfamily II DNA or RNA helicase
MAAHIRWEAHDAAIDFRVQDGQELVPIDEWGNRSDFLTDSGLLASPLPLVGLLEDERASELDGAVVRVPHEAVAGLEAHELAVLGLPPAAPHRLRIPAITANLTEPGFHFYYQFVHPENGLTVEIGRREGVLITLGSRHYVLRQPLYSLVERMDAFNAAPPEAPERRILAWGELQQLLPEGVDVQDALLRGMTVVVPTAFTLRPFVNASQEADFDVVPLCEEGCPAGGEPHSTTRWRPLPDARQLKFDQFFRKRSKVAVAYPAEHGWYVVIPDGVLRKSLEVVHKAQRLLPAQRKAFVLNPRVFLREGLGQAVPDEAVEAVFVDEGYGDRVRGIGLWQPKVIAWLRPASEPWLPPELLGLRLNGVDVPIDPSDLKGLIQTVESALAEGRPIVTYDGTMIPATEETLSALKRLEQGVAHPEPLPVPESHEPVAISARTVLFIEDNIFEPGALRSSAQRVGQVGALPESLQTQLLDHQREGLRWLQEHWVKGNAGALLADDMGLGKTLVSLALLAWLRDLMNRKEITSRPLLVVAPTGLLKVWVEELQKHFEGPGLGEPLVASGAGIKSLRAGSCPSAGELAAGMPTLDLGRLQESAWVLTTYESLRDYQLSFGRVSWGAIVFDEAQKIKNPEALLTDAAKGMNAQFRLAVTGTPVENRLADLWCIVDAVQPLRLGTLKEFCSRFEKPAQAGDLEPLHQLKSSLTESHRPPLMLRRLKSDHLRGLPPKQAERLRSPMPEAQAAAYERCIAEAREHKGDRQGMLGTLQRLRDISLHPFRRERESDEAYLAASARLLQTLKVLDEVHARREKVLVFLESREMQLELVALIQRRYSLRERPLIVNGAVSGPKRKDRADLFQQRKGFDALILSPRAGGVGLTLTEANHVIHLSRWWNPAVEDQCTDRVYRIGQERKVFVHYPMAIHPRFGDHSFDVRLDALLERKRELSQAVLSPVAFTNDDLDSLFGETVLDHPDPGHPLETVSLDNIDRLEPLAFENWVIHQLRVGGLIVRATPVTGDGGADLIGTLGSDSQSSAVIAQVKHTERNGCLGPQALREVLAARHRYPNMAAALPVVVTNAEGFTASARGLAQSEGILLVGRDLLLDLAAVVLKALH